MSSEQAKPTLGPEEIARDNYKAYMTHDHEVIFNAAPAFDAFALYGYRNGWMHVNGAAFSPEALFPEQHWPRHPADQGLSD